MGSLRRWTRHRKGKKLKEEYHRASPEQEALFPQHLSPIIQCKKSLLDRARIESYVAFIIGVALAVAPMNGLTRSLFMLLVLAPLVDIVWRSPKTHSWRTVTKLRLIALFVLAYLVTAATLIALDRGIDITPSLSDPPRWLHFIAGCVFSYLALKLTALLREDMQRRKAKKRELRERLLGTQKGWLDYRLDSENSSKQLHYFVARMSREMGILAGMVKRVKWFTKGNTARAKAMGFIYMITYAYDRYATKMEADLEEFEAAANTFIDGTQGYLKALRPVAEGDFVQLVSIQQYFESQLKDVRETANSLIQLPSVSKRMLGVSQELNYAVSRQIQVWQTQITIMRRLEKHCARMAKIAQDKYENALVNASKDLMWKVLKLVDLMKAKGIVGTGMSKHIDQK